MSVAALFAANMQRLQEIHEREEKLISECITNCREILAEMDEILQEET
jgi:hypothetical protein